MAKKLTKGKRKRLMQLVTEWALCRLIAKKHLQDAQRQLITNERQRRAYMAQYC